MLTHLIWFAYHLASWSYCRESLRTLVAAAFSDYTFQIVGYL